MVLSPGQENGQWNLAPMFNAAQLASQLQLDSIDLVFPYQDNFWLGCDKSLCEIDKAGKVHLHGADEGLPADSWWAC